MKYRVGRDHKASIHGSPVFIFYNLIVYVILIYNSFSKKNDILIKEIIDRVYFYDIQQDFSIIKGLKRIRAFDQNIDDKIIPFLVDLLSCERQEAKKRHFIYLNPNLMDENTLLSKPTKGYKILDTKIAIFDYFFTLENFLKNTSKTFDLLHACEILKISKPPERYKEILILIKGLKSFDDFYFINGNLSCIKELRKYFQAWKCLIRNFIA